YPPLNWPSLFLERKNVRQDLAGMLVVGQRVDSRNTGVVREFLEIALRVGAEHRPVYHPAQHARRVFDRFAAAHLNLTGRKKNYLSAELPNSHLKGNPRASRGLGKQHRPTLPAQRLPGFAPPLSFDDN